ncbi:hypothetical protein Pcinc_010747 [Petrolisthes cinctipes]|uniref:Out at first protein n=1 Tax=Petrolisthes cinctipes TaxID=88211 RepID=A0AAE1KTA8_PETCI|nr:hypothetical protein Pcinc_010747 [Petrolisthes cinctipes]
MKSMMVARELLIVLVLMIVLEVKVSRGQLVVNVKTQGGEVFKETITANISDDSVLLEFPQSDGTYITQLIDFKQELQIFKVIVLGEEELGQSQYQVMCFVLRFFKNNFISSDAMSKLRQKNPGTVRVPEEDRGTEEVELDVSVDVSRAGILSPHLPRLCSLAPTATYASDRDIKLWATQRRELDGDWSLVSDVTHHLPTRGVARCGDSGRSDLSSPCVCHYQVCIAWYPCGLKYCKGRDNSGKAVSYRCGIRTCRKCRNFSYFVAQQQLCLWDE